MDPLNSAIVDIEVLGVGTIHARKEEGFEK